MNWNIFYLINKAFLETMAIGFFYLIILGGLILALKLLLDSIKEEDGID